MGLEEFDNAVATSPRGSLAEFDGPAPRGGLSEFDVPDLTANSRLTPTSGYNPAQYEGGVDPPNMAANNDRLVLDYNAGLIKQRADERQSAANESFANSTGSDVGNEIRRGLSTDAGGTVPGFVGRTADLFNRGIQRGVAGLADSASDLAQTVTYGSHASPKKLEETPLAPAEGVYENVVSGGAQMLPSLPAYMLGGAAVGALPESVPALIRSGAGMMLGGAVSSKEGRTFKGASTNFAFGGSLVPAAAAGAAVAQQAIARGLPDTLAATLERFITAGGAGIPAGVLSAAEGAPTQQVAADVLLNAAMGMMGDAHGTKEAVRSRGVARGELFKPGEAVALTDNSEATVLHDEPGRLVYRDESTGNVYERTGKMAEATRLDLTRKEAVEADPEVQAADVKVSDATQLANAADSANISVEAQRLAQDTQDAAHTEAEKGRSDKDAEIEKAQQEAVKQAEKEHADRVKTAKENEQPEPDRPAYVDPNSGRISDTSYSVPRETLPEDNQPNFTMPEFDAPQSDAAPEAPATSQGPLPYTTGKNADTNIDRDAILGRRLTESESVSWEKNRQMAHEQEVPKNAVGIAESLLKKPRSLKQYETVGFVEALSDLKRRWERNKYEIENAPTEEAAHELAAHGEMLALNYEKITNALKLAGSFSGRELNIRKYRIDEGDDDELSIRTRLRIAKGEKLTGVEKARAKEAAASIERIKGERAQISAKEGAAVDDAIDSLISEATPKPKAAAKPVKRVISEDAYQAAKQRARDKTFGRSNAFVDPTLLADWGIIGGYHLESGVRKFSEWAAKMVEDLGDVVKPHLKAIYDEATGKKGISERIFEKAADGDSLGEMHPLVQKLAREFLADGIRDREELVSAVHDVLKEILPEITNRETRDAISGYGDWKPLSKDEVSVELSRIKGESQQISKIEDILNGIAPPKTGQERRVQEDSERRLIKQVNELKRRNPDLFRDEDEGRLKGALESVKTRLRNQISDMSAEIESRSRIVKEKTSVKYDAETDALIKRRDELQKQHDQIFAPDIGKLKERLAKRHAELLAMRRTGIPPERQKRLNLAERIGTDEAARVDFRLSREKRKIRDLEEKLRENQKTPSQRFFGKVGETFNLSRAVMTSFDLSAYRRQGGFLVAANLGRAAKAFIPMLRAFKNPVYAFRVNEKIHRRRNAPIYAKAKLYIAPYEGARLTAQEESYMSRFAEKIPFVAGSERAYVTFLNKLRADTFDSIAASLSKNGKLTPEEYAGIANFINVATGRGNLRSAEQAAQFLNTYLFAPRFLASRFQLATGMPLGSKAGSNRVRRAIAFEYAKYIAGVSLINAMWGLAGYAATGKKPTVETDKASADFGKQQFGNTRLDLWSGLQQPIVFMYRLGTGRFKSTQPGAIADEKRDPRRMGLVIFNYGRSKLSPITAAGLNLMTGEDVEGNKTTVTGEAARLVIPISFTDVYAAAKEHGWGGSVFSAASLLGEGVMTYQARKK